MLVGVRCSCSCFVVVGISGASDVKNKYGALYIYVCVCCNN
jgi:hypothetical protein